MNDIAVVPMPGGKFVIIDADDNAPDILRRNWHAQNRDSSHPYAVGHVPHSGKPGYQEFLHRKIMRPPDGMVVDHINGNTLDNRTSNLRICTQSMNLMNRSVKQGNNTSGYTGVGYHKCRRRWRAYITVNSQQISLGYHDTAEDAARARDRAAALYHGEFAFLNFPKGEERDQDDQYQ